MVNTRHDWTDGDIATSTRLDAFPGGVIGYATASADQSGISSTANLTGLSVTFTAESARLYRTTIRLSIKQLTAPGNAYVYLADGSNTQIDAVNVTGDTNDLHTLCLVSVETGLSGSTTRKARASTDAGTITVLGSANFHPTIIVEDLGVA